ncbi:MAG TPA: TlpA disulfide reductase family protein [Thermoanaerobaculia bacterium]|nr:TlpA disulfide reductase family protein [Thermoanaerobaculia bacterium]
MMLPSLPQPLVRRRGFAAVCIAAGLAVLLATPPAAAQDVRLRALQGQQALSEADLAQGATILVIWTSWSPHSRNVVARVNSLAERWGGRARVVTVNFQEDRGAVEGFLSGKGLSAPVFLDPDGSFSKKHKVTTLPCLLIFKDGQTVYNSRLPENPDAVISEVLR